MPYVVMYRILVKCGEEVNPGSQEGAIQAMKTDPG